MRRHVLTGTGVAPVTHLGGIGGWDLPDVLADSNMYLFCIGLGVERRRGGSLGLELVPAMPGVLMA